jgi:hypothetical protein
MRDLLPRLLRSTRAWGARAPHGHSLWGGPPDAERRFERACFVFETTATAALTLLVVLTVSMVVFH